MRWFLAFILPMIGVGLACTTIPDRDRIGGSWADVEADNGTDCYVGPDEVRFSAYAQTVTRCKGEIVMLGTLCFHRMGNAYADALAELRMYVAGYKDVVDLMPQTTSSILACVNADGDVWLEQDWRSL